MGKSKIIFLSNVILLMFSVSVQTFQLHYPCTLDTGLESEHFPLQIYKFLRNSSRQKYHQRLVWRYEITWHFPRPFCFLQIFATNLIIFSRQNGRFCLCGLVVRVPGYRSRDPRFDSRRCQILWEVVGLERVPVSLVSITEELLEW
jgi:hypothetical protein